MKSYRLVICIDTDAEDLADAYGKIYRFMWQLPTHGLADWESTDEAYVDGEELGPDELQKARMKFFKTMEKEE